MNSTKFIDTYYATKQQVHSLQYSYYLLHRLQTDKKLIRLINKIRLVEFFTYGCLRLCINDVVLSIFKILDTGSQVLSFQRIVDELKHEGNNVSGLERILRQFNNNTKHILFYRHNKIAHTNYEIHVNPKSEILKGREITRKQIRESVESACKFLKTVEKILDIKSPVKFNYESAKIQVRNHVDELYRVLEKASKYGSENAIMSFPRRRESRTL